MSPAPPDPEPPAACWPEPARPDAQLRLVLDNPPASGEPHPAHDISAAACAGDTLFLAADEAARLEVLARNGEGFGDHQSIRLTEHFELPGGEDEMDIEGLAVDEDWPWIVGSHSLTRRKPGNGKPLDADALKKLAKLKDNPNRMFLGRLPLRKAAGGARWEIATNGDRRAQMLPIGKSGSRLYKRLQQDPHIGPFCALPAKENGLDVEGLVVDGARVALGLRGPVINGWAIVIEAQIVSSGKELALDGGIAKRFLDLRGLGVRDLKRFGDDVVILAGPTLKLDGPTAVFRWAGWKQIQGAAEQLHRPAHLFDLPHGLGCDHPEALAPYDFDGDAAALVVCDKPGDHRLAEGTVLADVFRYRDR